ncbi:LLM class F420-dependent oxidoreductase [Mycolicibacterium duvalii]|uniref:LLM class F420-dependent oxidoreductase n=1 Tax=Mycolicibacterium duvalii TaxID=39688 RepID=A0A7I7K8J0_9MYCO|nr:TIGR03564 family F420-dependent LLM class oxidoreductase [Mycolicibacterium duvalii]MCV7368167.1 TIGR03564 family F420-dependent LLM class oxidoreductase [Mycolicibacterium duvalii]PEG43348.1 LLM class F420-dependent oxidoreductase [Mycolicibacterium duvalii]BBX19821.1 LLM class F420-dependent oxidoreductase [Mycolicibacterium duvalii]
MRIGLTGGGATVDKIVTQAQRAEADGFTSLWYASGVAGDPLVAMAIAGRATTSIELGTAVLQTYPCHPLLQANRVAAAANAMGRPGLTLGLGPSHEPIVSDVLGLSYAHPAASTREYLQIVTALLAGADVDVDGTYWSAHSGGRMVSLEYRVPVLVSALSPRMLEAAGEFADGVVLWMASATVIAGRIGPTLRDACARHGRPAPRIVAGLPVAVHDDAADARAAIAATASGYERMSNYANIIRAGGGQRAADVAIVGDEAAVARQLTELIDAGATDVWAQPVAVGQDRTQRSASLQRTRTLLSALTR